MIKYTFMKDSLPGLLHDITVYASNYINARHIILKQIYLHKDNIENRQIHTDNLRIKNWE